MPYISESTQGKPKARKIGDKDDFLRVGGKMHYSVLNYDDVHPILLSSKHSLTLLIFKHKHIKLLHAGSKMFLSTIKFWIVYGRNLLRKIS